MSASKVLAFSLVTLAAVAAGIPRAEAATYTWTATSGYWSTAGNWSGGVPASAATTSLVYSGATTWSSSNDILGQLSLNSITFGGAGNGTLAEATTGGNTGLNFVANGGTAPTIAMNGAGNISLANSMAITGNLTINVASTAGTLTLGAANNNNWLTGGGSLTINNSATSKPVVLMGSNSYTGIMTVGPATSTGTGLQLANANALAQGILTLTATSGTFPVDLAFSPGIVTFNVGELFGAANGNSLVKLQDTSGASINLQVGGNNASWTTTAFINSTGTLTKVGSGNMTLNTQNNNWTGGLGLSGGSVTLPSYNYVHTSSEPFFFNGGALVYQGPNYNSFNQFPWTIGPSGGTLDVTTANITLGQDDGTTGSGTLSLGGPGQVWFGNYGANYTGWAGGIIVNNGTLMQDTAQLTSIKGLSVNGAGQFEMFNDTGGNVNYSFSSGATITLSGTGAAGYGGAVLCLTKSGGAFVSTLNNAITLAGTSSIVVGEYTTTPSTLSLTGNISGAGGLIKDFAASLPAGRRGESAYFTNSQGILALGGTNTYAGTTVINAGTVLLQSNSALPATTAVTISSSNGSTLDLGGFNATTTRLLSSGVIASGGTVTNSGAANSTLTLALASSTSDTFSGIIQNGASKTVALVINGSGQEVLSGANTFTGGTTINGGTLQLVSGAFTTSSASYNIVSGAFLNLNGAGANLIPAVGTTSFSGGGTLLLSSGSLDDTTANTRHMTFTLSPGALINVPAGTYFNPGNFQSATWTSNQSNLTVNGTFDLWNGNAVIVDALSGSGTITAGFAGAAPSLTVGVANSSGTFSGSINNGISTSPPSFIKTGGGVETLTGSNTYTGATKINGGTLQLGSGGSINFSQSILMANGTTFDVSPVAAYTLASGQTLSGTGNFTISGTMAVGSGATLLTPTALTLSQTGSPRTVNVGGLTLNTGSLVNMDLAPSGSGDVVNVSGSNGLTVNGGSISLYQPNGIIPLLDRGTYTLMNYIGSLQGAASNSTAANPVPGLQTTYTFAATPTSGTSGALTVTIGGGNYWTGLDVSNGSSNWGDSANWSVSAPSGTQALAFSSTTGLSNTNDIAGLNPASVIFDSTAGAFVLSGSSIQLGGPIYNGGASTQTFNMNLGISPNQAITTVNGNLVFNGVLSDGGSGYGITVNAGSATVFLAAPNTYSGNTSVTSGTLQLQHSLAVQNSSVAPIGAAVVVFDQSGSGAFTFGGLAGTAPIALTDTGSNPVALTIGNNNASTAYSGILSGSGSLIKIGTGAQTLSGASTFNGGVTINGGTIRVNTLSIGGTNASALGEGPANASGQSLTLNGGMLVYTGAQIQPSPANSALAWNPTINLMGSGGTLDNLGSGGIGFSGGLTGSGNLTIAGTGSLQVFLNTSTFNASSGFTGNIIIASGGHLQQRTSAANPLGTVATITINPGGVLQSDSGASIPTTLVNNLIMNGGTLQLQNPGLMTYAGSVDLNSGTSTLWTSGGTSQIALSGNVWGSGSANSLGNPTIFLAGNNSSFGGTWTNASTGGVTFQNANAGSPNAVWVTNNGLYTASIAGTSTISLGALSGTSGTVNSSAGTTIYSVGGRGLNTTFGGLITNGSGITGLTVVGGGLTLSNTYNYTGPTTISGGTLQLQSPTVAPAAASFFGNIANNSTLLFANTGAQSYVNQISGTGGVTFAGPGTLSLAASQTYTGQTAVTVGTLAVVAVAPTALQLGLNGTATDSTGNNNNATLFNSPSYSAGFLPGQALSLNGSNQYATVPFSPSLSLTGAYTVSLWEKGTLNTATSASSGGPALFSTRNGNTNGLDIQVNSAGLHSDIAGLSSLSVSPTFLTTAANSTVALGSGWNMITMAVSSSGYSIYVNGSLSASGTYSTAGTLTPELFASSASTAASVGDQSLASAYGSGSASVFNGSISQVDVFNSALSAAQVAALYNNPASNSLLLPNGSPVSLTAGATLNLGNSQTVGSLAGAGTVTAVFNSTGGSTGLPASPTLTVGTDNSSQTFSGLLQDGAGTLSVVKSGSGIWTLGSNNTYSGNTTASGGTLQLGSSGSTGSLGSGGLTMGDAWLSFNRSDTTVVFPYSITSGTVSQDGSGMTTLALNNSHAGGTFINGGTLQVGNGGSTGSLGSGPVVINGSLALARSDAFFTLPNTLSGSGAIYQNGSGTTTLSGPASGFTGPITVSSGNLYLNTTNSTSYINVASGAVLGGKGSASSGTAEIQNNASIEAGQNGTGNLTLAGLQLDNNASINLNNLLQYSSTNNTAAAAITVTGSNALWAQTISQYALVVNLGYTPFFNTVPQNARILAYSGSDKLGQLGNLSVANNNLNVSPQYSSRASFSFLPLSADPGYIDLQFSVDYPIWTGAGNGVWDNNVNQSPQNWKLASSGTNNTPTNFLVNDSVVFDDSAGSGFTVVSLNGTGSVDPVSVTFNNNVLGYTLSGANAIDGAALVTFNGTGSVTIWNTNTYYGGTTLNAGLLNIGNQFALGLAPGYVSNGAVFAINGGSIDNVSGGSLTTDNYPINWNAGFTFIGSNPLNLGAGAVTLTTSAAAVNVSGSTLEIDGAIGDLGQGFGFTQNGSGVLLLAGSNTYLGPTIVNGGTLEIGNGGSGASVGSTSNVVLAANTLLLFNHNDSQTFPASISGSGSLIQSGAGLLNLTNTNTYSGGTTVVSGSLELSVGGPNGTLAPGSTVNVNGGAALVLNAQNSLGTSASYTNLNVLGASQSGSSGGLVFANSGNRVSLYSATMTGGTLASAAGTGDGNGNYSLSGTLNATSDSFGNSAAITATQVSLLSNTVLNVTHGSAAGFPSGTGNTGPADLVVTSVISSLPSGNGLTLQGNGFTQFAGASTYNGGTTVLGGTLQLARSTATLGATSGGLTVAGGALLDMNGVNTSVGGLNGGGTIDNLAGTFGAAPTLTFGNGNASGTFSGTIQDTTGSTKLVKTGTGTESLSGTNSYGGTTTINAGVLNFGSSALGAGLVSFGGGTLQWAASNTVDVSTTPGIAAIGSGKVANLDTNGNNVTFNSSMSGAGGLSKIGAGMLTLAAADTFSGATSITGGTLNLANPQALQNSTANVSIGNSLVLSGAATSAVTLGGLSGSGAFNLGTAALTVGANNSTTTYSGVLGGGTGLTKAGSGTLTLNTPNINGPTNITGGVLAVQNNTVAIKVGSAISGTDGPNGAGASNWNNLLGTSPGGSNLIDNFGLATSTAMNTTATSGTFGSGSTDPLLASYVYKANGTITVNLTGIPYSSYSIYAFSADATAGHQNALSIGGSNYYFTAEAANTFDQITNSNSASFPTGNYAVASGQTGASQTLTISSTTDTGFSGFEIVNTSNSLAASPVTISNSGTFNMANGMQTIASLSSTDGNGSKVVLGNGLLTIGPNPLGAGASSTFDGVISGSGGQVVLQGPSSTVFTGSNTYTGSTAINGGTLQLGDGTVHNGSVATNIALASNATITFANPSTQLYTGVVSGTGSLTKTGPGTLQLIGTHTYSGPTVINAGTVQLGFGVNPQVSVLGFGSSTSGFSTAAGYLSTTNPTWTFNSYNYASGFNRTWVTGGSLDLTDGSTGGGGVGAGQDRSAFYNTPVPVNTSFQVTFTYTPAVPVNGANDSNGFAFVLAKSGGLSMGGAGRGFGVGSDPEGAFNNNPIGNSMNIDYDVYQGGPYFGQPAGAATGFNTNGGTNTGLTIFGGNSYVPGDPINMTVSYNALTQVLTWSGTDAAKSLTFSEGTAGVNLQSITGGTSAFIGFTGANGYIGTTQTISAFNFATTNFNGALPSTTPLLVSSGGTLDLFGVSQAVGDLSGAGVVTNSFSPSLATLTAGGDNTSQSFSGTLQNGGGTLAFTKVGSGGMTLAGANTYTGATVISGGTLQLGTGAGGQDGSIVTASSVTNNAVLVYDIAGNQTAGYAISGSGAVTMIGGGQVTLSHSNNFSGGTQIQSGTLQLGNTAALGSGALVANGGTLDLNSFGIIVPSFSGAAGVVTDNSGSSLSLATSFRVNQSASTTFNGSFQPGTGGRQVGLSVGGTGSLTLGGTSSLSVANVNNTATLVINGNLSAGSVNVNSPTAGGARLAGNGGITLTSVSAGLTYSSSAASTFAGTIAGLGGLTVTRSELTLGGTNSYSGNTSVSGGTLQMGAANALPYGASAGNATVNGVLDLAGQATSVNGLSGTGTVDNSSGTGTLVVGNNGVSSTFSGTMQNSAGTAAPMGLTKTGAGTFTLAGMNLFTGPATVQSGLLSVGGGGLAGPAIVTGGTLDLSPAAQSIYSLTMGSLGTLNLGMGNVISSAGTDTFGGTLDILGSIHLGPLMTYTGYSGAFAVNNLSSAFQLVYGATELDVISSGPPIWSAGASGSWNTGGNWNSGTPPGGIGATAIVGTATSSNVSVTLDGPQTLGTLVLTNSGGSNAAGYSLDSGTAGMGSLTLDNSGAASQITVNVGTHAITAPVYLIGGDLTVSASNGGVLTISGSISQDTTRNLTLNGDGSGELILSGTNNLGGSSAVATVSSGTLVLNNIEAVADGTSLTVGDASFFGGIQAAGGATASSAPLGAGGAGSAASLAPVPEPGTLALLVVLSGLGIYRGRAKALNCLRRRRRA